LLKQTVWNIISLCSGKQKILLFQSVLWLSFPLFSQQYYTGNSDSIIILSVQLLDESTQKPIPFAHIINLRTFRGGISDTSGIFRLPVMHGDLLRVSSIGYFDQYYLVPDSLKGYIRMDILMKQKIYLINEVRINTLGNYDQFRRKFISTELPDKEAREIQKQFRQMARDTAMKSAPVRTGIPLNFPSPEQRLEMQRQELYKKLREQRIMDDKFNPVIVSRLTGLQGDELYEFMRYCNFSRDFLLNTNHYDIMIATLHNFEQYKRIKGKNK